MHLSSSENALTASVVPRAPGAGAMSAHRLGSRATHETSVTVAFARRHLAAAVSSGARRAGHWPATGQPGRATRLSEAHRTRSGAPARRRRILRGSRSSEAAVNASARRLLTQAISNGGFMRNQTILSCSMSIAFLFGCGAAVEDGATDDVEVTTTDEESITFAVAPPVATTYPIVSPPVSPPASPPVERQRYADLAITHTPMTFSDIPGGTVSVSFEVMNVGNTSTNPVPGRVSFSNNVYAANLYSKTGATSLAPGETGSIWLLVPATVAKQCQQHPVAFDVDRNWQFDNFGSAIFDNDRTTLSAPCLAWTSPITEANLGTKPDPRILNKSLESIVSSFELASKLGYCSQCHYAGSRVVPRYFPNVPRGREQWIWDNEVIGDWRWAGPGGWAARFAGNLTKPEYLRKAFRKWAGNGSPRTWY
jgi:hypothetical protein